jgi:hypothetical protein
MKRRNVSLRKFAIAFSGLCMMGGLSAVLAGGGPNPGPEEPQYASKPILEGFVTVIARQDTDSMEYHAVAVFDGTCKKKPVNAVIEVPLTAPQLTFGFVGIIGTSIPVDALMGECQIPTNSDGVEANSIVVTDVIDFQHDPAFIPPDPTFECVYSNVGYPNPNGFHCGPVSTPVSAEIIAKFAF